MKLFFGLVCAAALAACSKPDGPVDPVNPIPQDYFMREVARISIETEGGVAVDSKTTYRSCTVKVDGKGVFEDLELSGKIRGRGNSTWLWYPKKPYRIKLDEKTALLGMPEAKTWALLADYRDVTHMMNNTGFTIAEYLGIPYANHSRYAELTLNGTFMGLYMVTEQVQEGNNRVEVGGDGGLLLALDVNDGPEDCPDATDNFWSAKYKMAVCVKYPDDAGAPEVAYAKAELKVLEDVIASGKWEDICAILDVDSMVSYLMAEEIIFNVEMNNGNSIRSGYINRAPGGKWTMGPLWDCDGAFSYDWSDMYDSMGKGHTYFKDYKRLVFGSDPYLQKGAYGRFPAFFSDLFGVSEFVKAFKQKWEENKDGMLDALLENIDLTYEQISASMESDSKLWGMYKNYRPETQVSKMKQWLIDRFDYLDAVFMSYPERN